ncbi:hypothetical protein [Mycolicibacterium palauense]|nr:hypothetical protein [Mycolicibacterium palauense]
MSDIAEVPPDPAFDPDSVAKRIAAEISKFNASLALDDEMIGWRRAHPDG